MTVEGMDQCPRGSPQWADHVRSTLNEEQREFLSLALERLQGQLKKMNKEIQSLKNQLQSKDRKLLEKVELVASLREEATQVSLFEQICNSGMLRNFKIDSESPFAQRILQFLETTMELQVRTLSRVESPRKDPEEEPPKLRSITSN